MFLKGKIGLLFVFLFAGVLAFVLAHISNVGIQRESISRATASDVNYVKSIFDEAQLLDTRTLSAVLEVISRDSSIQEIFLEEDREKLYEHAYPLFQSLKDQYDITHWYFILPTGEVFLRMHNSEIYGDQVSRLTFWQARDKGTLSSGIELGKTAYALRVVMPYFAGDELIGYLELGEKIDHFLEILKSETGSDFVFVADKRYLDEEKWSSVSQVAGRDNNWNDLDDYLVISEIAKEGSALRCFSEENMKMGERGQVLFDRFERGGNDFRCAGIALLDAGERQSGLLLSSIDISDHINIAKNANRIILLFSAALFILTILISICYFLLREHKGR